MDTTVTKAPGDDAGLWVTVTELADLKGVSHPAISKRMKRLETQNLIEVRTEGRTRRVNLAQWDRVTQENTDLSKLAGREIEQDAGAPAPPPTDPSAPVYSKEQARRAQYDADLKKLELDKQLGRVRDAGEIEAAATRCAEKMVRIIDSFPTMADDIMTANSRGGVTAVREALKAKARELRAALANEMAALAAGSDETSSD